MSPATTTTAKETISYIYTEKQQRKLQGNRPGDLPERKKKGAASRSICSGDLLGGGVLWPGAYRII
jgi:hypothetical protein